MGTLARLSVMNTPYSKLHCLQADYSHCLIDNVLSCFTRELTSLPILLQQINFFTSVLVHFSCNSRLGVKELVGKQIDLH